MKEDLFGGHLNDIHCIGARSETQIATAFEL